MRWPRFGEVVRTHRFVVAYDSPHDALSLELEGSLVRRGMKIFGTGALEMLEGEMFSELPSILHVGDAFVLILDAARFEDPQVLALLAAMRWCARRASGAFELVVVGHTGPQPESEGIHFVPPLVGDTKAVRAVAKKIVARAKRVPPRPRKAPSADEKAVTAVMIRNAAFGSTAFCMRDVMRPTKLPRDRVEAALRSAARRGWLEVTDLAPLRAGEPPDVFVALTELGWSACGAQVLPEAERLGTTLQDQRRALYEREVAFLSRDRWRE